jgi:DNA-binding NarL/FixJ family response regulator
VAKPKALVGILAPEIRDDIVRAARESVDLAAVHGEPDATVTAVNVDGNGLDLIIVDVMTLRALMRQARRSKPVGIWEIPPVILVLLRGDLQDALGLLHLCRGILFWEHDLDKLGRMIVTTLEGYSAVHPELLPDLVTDRVRVGLIERLAPVEQKTLRLLGEALSNRAIAKQLEVAEPVAKSLVRTVLTKLRLKNRTEAAVLVARWRGLPDLEPARDAGFSPEQIAL